MDIEKRKFDFLIKECKITEDYLDRRFELIDKRMDKVIIGLKMLCEIGYGDLADVFIEEIIDKENGILLIKETGYNNNIRKENVLNLYFVEEIKGVH